MINIGQIEGQMRASSLRKIAEMVEKHPKETLSIMRGWMVPGERLRAKVRRLSRHQRRAEGRDRDADVGRGAVHTAVRHDARGRNQGHFLGDGRSSGAVKSDVVERLCLDFVDHMGAAGNLIGSYESTERLLQKSLPRERASQIMEEIRGPAGRTMWDKLGNVHEAVLANYLKNEYPQTVAVVLSKVSPTMLHAC